MALKLVTFKVSSDTLNLGLGLGRNNEKPLLGPNPATTVSLEPALRPHTGIDLGILIKRLAESIHVGRGALFFPMAGPGTC